MTSEPLRETSNSLSNTSQMLLRAFVLGELALIFATWKLWLPQEEFPRVPLLGVLTNWPTWMHTWITWSALGTWLLAHALMLLSNNVRRLRMLVWAEAVSLIVLIVLDQHRLQPWTVHVGIALLILTYAQPPKTFQLLRWFTASIYVYSALGKLDAQFLYTVGQEFLGQACSFVGLDIRTWPMNWRLFAAALFPLFELVVGICVLVRPLRLMAWAGSLVMHGALIVILGPLGLHHALGVLFWNSLFIIVNSLLLLSRPVTGQTAASVDSIKMPTGAFLRCVMAVVLVVPLGERLGVVDHWLGWALYAPHSSRVQVFVLTESLENVPAGIRPHVRETDDPVWSTVAIDRWSLATLGVPLYPQQRFHLGIASALVDCIGENATKVDVLSVANRWTGSRTTRHINSRDELRKHIETDYWFNAYPVPFSCGTR